MRRHPQEGTCSECGVRRANHIDGAPNLKIDRIAQLRLLCAGQLHRLNTGHPARTDDLRMRLVAHDRPCSAGKSKPPLIARLNVRRRRTQRSPGCGTHVRTKRHASPIGKRPIHGKHIVNPTTAKPAITGGHRCPDTIRRRTGLRRARRDHDHLVIFNQAQNRTICRRPQRPLPVIARFVSLAPLCRKPRSRLEERIQGKIDDRLGSWPKLQIVPHRRHKQRRARPDLIFAGNQIGNQIASMKVGKRRAHHGESLAKT